MRPLLVLSLLLLACEKDKTRGKVSARQTSSTAVAAQGPFGDKDYLEKLYLCWQRNAYQPAFPTNRDGKKEYVAGINGIVYYGDLPRCLDGDEESKDFKDISQIEKVAGLKLKEKSEHGLFEHYNPEIITWGIQTLIPNPKQKIGDITAKAFYSRAMKRYFRLMAEAYIVLLQRGDVQAQVDAYLLAGSKGFPLFDDGVDYLQHQFRDWLPYPDVRDTITLTPQMAIGFWLRRHHDKTSGELWRGLEIILTHYDSDWYATVRAKYPTAASKLTSKPN